MKGSLSGLTKAFAHSENPHGEWHELIDHLEGVAERAREFADALGAPEYGHLLGLWHDVGKFHPQFQEYLHGRSPRGGDHKGAGAVLAVQCLGPAAMVIQGHHGGLKALAEFQAWWRERSQDPAVILALASARSRMELRESVQKLPAPPHLKTKESSEFWIRLLFSALVDADFLDTEAHFRPDHTPRRVNDTSIAELWQRFKAYQGSQVPPDPGSKVNRVREQVYQACLTAAKSDPGFFRLTVPTGGGKTRSRDGLCASACRTTRAAASDRCGPVHHHYPTDSRDLPCHLRTPRATQCHRSWNITAAARPRWTARSTLLKLYGSVWQPKIGMLQLLSRPPCSCSIACLATR